MKKEFDFIAIGDITTDAFIRIKDATVTCDTDKENCKICLRFGDKVPYERVEIINAVGNSPNAAVSAHRLGLASALVTNLGDDQSGKDDIKALEKEGIAMDFVKVHSGKESNYHYVLWYGAERTILVKHHEYPYALPDFGTPKWLYLSSMAESSLPFHRELARYMEEHPSVRLAFQPGTFQIQMGTKALGGIYTHSTILFCNSEEARQILKTEEKNIPTLLRELHALGPKMTVITDGPRGAYAFDSEKDEMWYVPMYPDPAPPYDRTGAGDAFASTVTAALVLGHTLPEALLLGPVNSMSVVQKTGAQAGLLTMKELRRLLAEAPKGYEVKKIR
jgi:sugar/nucleoside kinase (ribokinase family)